MFRRHKPSEISTVKSKKKFLSDKESTHKIKHLKILIDNLPNDELQAFFIENSSLIFQVFSDCFFGLEWDVRLKGSGNYVKDLELVLTVFEKILLLLPENIHKRWQYNCIIDVIEDLLYEKNTLKLRKRGIRLFLIWYQILGLNATHVCHKIFNNLIPEFGSLVTEYQKREKNSEQHKQNHTQSKRPSKDIRGQISQESRISHVVAPRERVALLTSAVVGEDESVDDESMVLLQVLLRYLVTESIKVEWLQLRYEQHLMQSWFLFEKLKHSYLPVIFPCLSPSYSVYSPTTSSVTNSTVPLTSNILQDYPIHPSRLSYYQLEFTCWLAAFVYTGPRTSNHPASSDGGFTSTFVTHGAAVGGGGGAGTSFHLGGFPWDTHGDPNEFQLSRQFRSLLGGSAHGEPETASHSKVNGISRLSNSPPMPAPSINQRDADDSVISTSFQDSLSQTAPVTVSKPNTYHLGKEAPVPPSILQASSAPQKFVFNEPVFNYSDKVVSMVHQVLYGCRQNINLIQDILHQALLLPLECHKALYYVTTVYGSWLENKYNRPIFMQPLDDSMKNWNELQKSEDRPSSTLEEVGTQGINSQLSDTKATEHSKVKQPTPDHTAVHNHPPMTKSKSEEDDAEELRGCLQNTIQIMLENMASVFYATSLDSNSSSVSHSSVNKSTTASPADYTKHQIELCRLVLQIFQYASNSNELTAETWSKLLSILMDIMRKTMINTSPTNVQNYKWLLNSKLTQNLFQTLNGALLRASLFSPISSEPWDQCLSVYSKLTHWPSLIIEWKKVMRMLTSTMAKLVYGVDLSDLPQEKKGPRIKRLAGSNVTNRARPKSLTEAVLNYTGSTSALSPPPVPFPSALSVLSVHDNLLDDNLVVMPPNSVDSGGVVGEGVGGCVVTEPEDGDHSEIRNQRGRRRRTISSNSNGGSSSSRRNSQEISEKPITYREIKPLKASAYIEKWTFENAYHNENAGDAKVNNASQLNDPLEEDESISLGLNDDLVDNEEAEAEAEESTAKLNGNCTYHVPCDPRPHSHLMLSARCEEESTPYSKDKASSTLVKGRQKSSVRRATSEITLQFKGNQRAPRVKESKFDPTFSAFTRDEYQRRLHSEVPQHHHLSDSLDILTTGTLAGRYSHPADFTASNNYKHQRYFQKSSDTHQHHHQHHHSGSRTSTAVSCAEDDSLSLSQNGIHTSSCASGEEVLHESVKFDIDSPKGGFVGDFFNENRDLHPSDIRKSSDILSDEHSSSESNRRDTLTAAATATAGAAPDTDTTNVNDVTITDAAAPTKTLFVTPEDQLNAMDLPRCILAGGPAFGWTHESIIICWRRFLGVLGSFYKINNPSTLLDVFQYLNEMTTCLLKIREYQIVPCVTETCVQPIPPFVPPVEFIAPVLFDSLNLSEDFVESKQLAIRTLSDIVVRFHDGCPDPELIAQFYYLVHRICVSKEEKYVFEIIRSCSMRIFVSSLPSTHLLILDFLNGVNVVLTNPSPGPEVPRSEAISVILSLLCYPHHFESLESIESTCLEPRIIACNDLKSQLVQLLTQAVLLDPSAEVRCLAITGLSIYCVIEIMISLGSEHKSSTTAANISNTTSSTAFDSLFHDSVIILLGMMRFQNRIVAIVAVDMIHMFADYCSIISSRDVKLASLILLSLAWTLFTTWDNTNVDNMTAVDKRFFLGLIQAITEWSMRMPYDQLLINRETKPGSLLPSSNVLGTLIEVFCFIISSNDTTTTTSQSLMNPSQSSTGGGPLSQIQSNIYFTDPLLEYLATCKNSIDIGLFNSPKTGLDVSSLTIKSWLFTGSDNSLSGFNYNENIDHVTESVRLAARMALSHMLNHLDQFPMSKDGVQINTSVQEHHDQFYPPTTTENDFSSGSSNNNNNNNNNNTDVNTDDKELTPDVFEQNNLQIFVLDRSILLTFISLPIMKLVDEKKKKKKDSEHNNDTTDVPVNKDYQLAVNDHSSYIYLPYSSVNSKEDVKTASLNSTFVTNPFYTRIIARDLSGKYAWDASYLYNSIFELREHQQLQSNEYMNGNLLSPIDPGDDLHVHLSREPPPCPPPRMNPPPPLLNGLTSPVLHSLDQLNDVLRDLASTSPECSITWSASKLSEYEHVKEKSDKEISTCLNMEKMTCDQITSQCQMDEDIIHKKLTESDVISLYASPELPGDRRESLNQTTNKRNAMQFDNARHLLNQFGYLSWRHRPTVELLQKSPALVRELKHLDNLGSRETHKLAIFYVGAGQEDKQSILSNQTASLEFENFVAGLGWEIDLLTHKGFRGGLERSGRAGHSTPYFVTSTLEVIFHVSTRMPSSTQEDLKYKHLGNDEIMIIWNENSRAFRRSVLRTQFGDVLIIISPLLNGLYKVEVRREAQVGLFGPIVESAVLSANVLPGLVRATAINASRAVRAMKPGYHHPYEGRAASLQQIVSKYTLPTSFEEYAESILLPNTKPGYHNQSTSPSINKSSGVKFVSITPNPPSISTNTNKYESHYNYPHTLSAPNFSSDDFNSTNNQRSNYTNNKQHAHDVRQREHIIPVHLNRPPAILSRTPSVTRIKSSFPALSSDHNFNSVSPLVNYNHSPAPLQSAPAKVHNNNHNNINNNFDASHIPNISNPISSPRLLHRLKSRRHSGSNKIN